MISSDRVKINRYMQPEKLKRYNKRSEYYRYEIEYWCFRALFVFLYYWIGCGPIYVISRMTSVWFTGILDIVSRWMIILTVAWVLFVNLRYIAFYYYWIVLWLNEK